MNHLYLEAHQLTEYYIVGSCCIYVVFIAKNIKSIADYFMDCETDIRLFMLIILLPIILINWVIRLKSHLFHKKKHNIILNCICL